MKLKIKALPLGVAIGLLSSTDVQAVSLEIETLALPSSYKAATEKSISGIYDYSDHQPWSVMPPANLRPVQVPLFISIGFDDNGSKEGMDWIVNYAHLLNNPVGSGQATTFDGAPVRFSFYNTASYIEASARDPIGVKQAWYNAWLDGHEMGNHTWSHRDGGPDTGDFTAAVWKEELGVTQEWLSKPYNPTETVANNQFGSGIPTSELIGFRTPFLNYNNNLFPVLKELGFVYDTSIEEGWSTEFNGTNNPWPYTLDQGTPTMRVGKPPVGHYPGLWQLPTNVFERPEGGKIVGFDTNMWVGGNMRKEEVLAILKHNLHLRLEGNRSPLLFGAHIGIYSSDYDSGGRASNYLERQQAIEEFVQYAMNLKVNGENVVRIVPFKEIVEWMRNPIPLNNNKVVSVESLGASPIFTAGQIYRKGDQVFHNGQYFEARWYADGAPGAVAPDYDPWKLITKAQANKVVHLGSVTPAGDVYGDVSVDSQTGQTFYFEAAANAQVKNVTLNGVSLGSITQYTFKDLTGNQTLKVEFVAK